MYSATLLLKSFDNPRIGKVQRQFTKRLYGFKHLCYEERLTKLRIPSLELRHCTWTSRTVIKLYLDSSLWTWLIFFEFSQFTGTRGHAYKLYKPRSDCTVRMNFFANRVINAWIIYPLLSVLLVYPPLVGLLGALILEIFWNVIVVNLKGSC